MVLKIFRAADAFLYLPLYLAEEFGIFDTLLNPLGITDVEFITPSGGSDKEAIRLMLEENNNQDDSIAIAIADPTAFLARGNFIGIDNIRVIGAIINKLPFCIVNHNPNPFSSIPEFQSHFNKVIHYKEALVTGYYLGTKVKNEANISPFQDVDFGTEVDTLISSYNPTGNEKTIAITADIARLAKGMLQQNNPISINYKFWEGSEHLTTSILTSKRCCEGVENINKLNKIIEATQKSISILYSSKKIAEKICETIAARPEFNTLILNTSEITRIIDLVYEGRFYPADLNITKNSWNEAIKALGETERWDSKKLKETLKISFDKYVDNTFVLNSEKEIASQFGIIVPDTDEIKQYYEGRGLWRRFISIMSFQYFGKLTPYTRAFILLALSIFVFINSPDLHVKDFEYLALIFKEKTFWQDLTFKYFFLYIFSAGIALQLLFLCLKKLKNLRFKWKALTFLVITAGCISYLVSTIQTATLTVLFGILSGFLGEQIGSFVTPEDWEKYENYYNDKINRWLP